MQPPATPNLWTLRLWAIGLIVVSAVLMFATEPRLSIVWDEGYTLGREARVRLWFRALRDPSAFAKSWTPPTRELVQPDSILLDAPRSDQIDTRAKLFAPNVLAWFWPFAREEPHGHPPFYALLGLVGDFVAPGLPDLPRARVGPILAFSLLSGAIFLFLAKRWGWCAGFAGAGSWLLQPNLFAHAHYAAYDAPLTCLWVAAILAFAKAIEPVGPAMRRPRIAWALLFGVLCGWAADTKLTGWFLPIPFLVWAAIYRDRKAFQTLLIGGLVGVLTLYAFNPGWWAAPIGGVDRFLRSNLTRGKTIVIEVMFLGKVYKTPNESLPVYNTLLWTLFVTPVGLLALALVGAWRSLRLAKSEPFGLLVLGHWVFLLLLRSLPKTPGHDGVRLFLPAFGMLALSAGLGAAEVVRRWPKSGRWVIGGILAAAGVSLALSMPVPLSYYSPMVGGLRGATKLGMEPTYYWDALNDDALNWLNAHTPPGGKVRFATYPSSWLYLKDSGRLKPGILPSDLGTWTWYVVQNRPGAMTPSDREIVAKVKPAYVVEKFGVPLIWIFPDPLAQ